jgi:flagellar basal body-associated protein FliL
MTPVKRILDYYDGREFRLVIPIVVILVALIAGIVELSSWLDSKIITSEEAEAMKQDRMRMEQILDMQRLILEQEKATQRIMVMLLSKNLSFVPEAGENRCLPARL